MNRRFAWVLMVVGFGLGWIAAPAGMAMAPAPDHAPFWLIAR